MPERDNTKIIEVPADYQIPEKYKDRVHPATDRAATVEEALQVASMEESPIVVWLDRLELAKMYFNKCTPYEFMQSLLEAFKQAGAPVEGRVHLKLAHGAIAKVKPDPAQQEMGVRYMWLPTQHVEVLAMKGLARS